MHLFSRIERGLPPRMRVFIVRPGKRSPIHPTPENNQVCQGGQGTWEEGGGWSLLVTHA